jgi:2-hydroxychromene-2-carboxylate isomerase
MGDVIFLADRGATPTAAEAITREPLARAFYFDLTCPLSYLDGDRVERVLGETEWRPAPAHAPGGPTHGAPRLQARVELRAEAQRLPLSWPERWGGDCRGLHRAAAYASERGAGAGFAMAALRLGFGGGFDLADLCVLEEAAAATGLSVQGCLAAAADRRWDLALRRNRQELARSGPAHAPAIRIGERWFAGERAITDAGHAVLGAPRGLGNSAA